MFVRGVVLRGSSGGGDASKPLAKCLRYFPIRDHIERITLKGNFVWCLRVCSFFYPWEDCHIVNNHFALHSTRPRSRYRSQYLRLCRKPKTRRSLSLIKDSVNALQENISKDRETNSIVRLNSTVAGAATSRSKVDVATRNNKSLTTNSNAEVRQSSATGENVTALGVAVRGTGDLGVVSFDISVRDEQESGAGVCDGTADVAAGGELPEAIGAVDGDVGDGAGVLGAVDVAEVVSARGTLLQIDGEELLLERGLDGVEEGGLPSRSDGVDGAESEAEEAVVVGVFGELGGDLSGGFDGLRGCGDGSHHNLVSVDIATGSGAVLIGDLPGSAGDLPARCRRVVLGVACGLAGGGLG
jgi:hypothetical protein